MYEVENKKEIEGEIKKDVNAKIISKCSGCAVREKRYCVQFRWIAHKSAWIKKDRS